MFFSLSLSLVLVLPFFSLQGIMTQPRPPLVYSGNSVRTHTRVEAKVQEQESETENERQNHYPLIDSPLAAILSDSQLKFKQGKQVIQDFTFVFSHSLPSLYPRSLLSLVRLCLCVCISASVCLRVATMAANGNEMRLGVLQTPQGPRHVLRHAATGKPF